MANKRAKRHEAIENATRNRQSTMRGHTIEKHDEDTKEASENAPATLDPGAPQTVQTTPSCTSCSTNYLFIASLGNPAPHENSRHSAGHIILNALRSRLGFTKAKRSKAHAGGLISEGVLGIETKLALWQCPSFMNDSGTSVLKAYRNYVTAAHNIGAGNLPLLVLLHDEMEAAPGDLKVSSGFKSARGHNGVKSVQISLQSAGLMKLLTEGNGEARFIRIGVGIGRPTGASRQKEDIAAHVLGTLNERERKEMQETSAQKLMDLLEEGIPCRSCTD